MITPSDSFSGDTLDAPRFSAWDTRKAAVVVSDLHVSFKMEGSALGSADALLCAVEMNAGCTPHGRLGTVIEEPGQRGEREHESCYTSKQHASASTNPVEEQR